MRWGWLIACFLLLASEVAAQEDPTWMGRAQPGEPRKVGPPPSADGVPTEGTTATAQPKNAFEKLVAFFLGPSSGYATEERSWGFVPLVVADSNAGFGGGVEFVENELFGTRTGVEFLGLYTSNQFFATEGRVNGPPIYAVDWRIFARYRSRPRLFFWGIGNDTEKSDRLSLWLEETYVEGRLGLVLTEHAFLFGIGEFHNEHARDGRGDVPPVSSQFNSQTLTGFESNGYTNGIGGSAILDFRDDLLSPTRGGKVEVRAVYHGPQIGDSPYQYGSYVADASAFVPLTGGKPVVLGIGARLEAVDASLNAVPFYALPALGGTRSLRGYLESRFRDRDSLLFQIELRFPIWRVLSGAVFADAGRVFDSLHDPPLFKDYHVDGGAGLRLIIQPDIFTRLDFAVSNEDFTFALEFGNAF
jgi:hypothetical protein